MKQNKTTLWKFVSKQINHKIHRLHVMSVVSILLEELIRELKLGNKINIGNFGTFELRELRPKKVRNIATKQIKFVGKTKALRLKLSKKLLKYLLGRS